MKNIITLMVVTIATSASVATASAQISLTNLLNSETTQEALTTVAQEVVSAVTGGETISATNLAGTWDYANPAVVLTSDSALKEAAATVATSKVESYMTTMCEKVGIASGSFSYTFNEDLTFSCTLKSKTLSGTYTFDNDAKTIALNFTSSIGSVGLGTMDAECELSGDSLSLLFQADKLITFISTISSVTDNSTISLINSVISEYDGVNLGFNLARK